MQWWIKSDGTDIVCGITKLMRGDWAGDVDLGDGSVTKQHESYQKRIGLINRLKRKLTIAEERSHTVANLKLTLSLSD